MLPFILHRLVSIRRATSVLVATLVDVTDLLSFLSVAYVVLPPQRPKGMPKSKQKPARSAKSGPDPATVVNTAASSANRLVTKYMSPASIPS
jgi:hypothetical protein